MTNKLIDRQGFNFYKSYYDVYKEMNPKNRLAFMDALLKKEFENEESDLKGMAKFAYLSQKHSIDKQVKGYIDKLKAINKDTPSQGGADTPTEPPSPQEQVQGEEQEQEQEKEEEKEEEQVFDEVVEPVQPLPIIPEPKPKKEPSEVTIFKNVFEPEYKRLKGLDFYWNGAEAASCKKLIAAMKFLWEKEGHVWDIEIAKQSLVRMINVDDRWIQDNMSLKILNSKFNDIISILKNGKSTTRNEQTDTERKLELAAALSEKFG